MRTILSLVLSASLAWPAISYDTSNSAFSGNGATGLTFSHTAGSLSSGILIVGVEYYETARSVSTITYAGTSSGCGSPPCSFSKIRRDNNGAQNAASELWYILAPAAGANNIVITMDAAMSVSRIAAASVSLACVSQGAPEAQNGSVVTGTHTSHSISVTTAASNAWLVDTMSVIEANTTGFTASGSQVARQTLSDGGLNIIGVSTLGPIATPASTAVDWSFPSVGTATAHSAASFAPSASCGVAVRHKVVNQ